MVRYTGKSRDIRLWRGKETDHLYKFGGDKRLGYVDMRDVKGFVQPLTTGGAMPVFEVVDE
jgi:hypothetical protein